MHSSLEICYSSNWAIGEGRYDRTSITVIGGLQSNAIIRVKVEYPKGYPFVLLDAYVFSMGIGGMHLVWPGSASEAVHRMPRSRFPARDGAWTTLLQPDSSAVELIE